MPGQSGPPTGGEIMSAIDRAVAEMRKIVREQVES
jgi:hypothetical protein